MKRIFLFVCALCALTLITPCFAEDSPATEVVDEVTAPTEEVTEEVTEPAEDTAPVEDDEWETFKSKITDSATWTMIGAALVTILTTVGTVKSKFDGIASLVRNKADNETVAAAIKDMEKELRKSYNDNHKEVSAVMKRYEEAIKNTEENEQKLYAILTLFMTNCKISESAKAEILNILANVKKYEGSVSEFVEKAQEAINKQIEEKEASAPATPTLDEMLNEDYMDLG